jgi:flagellar protein FliL
VSDTATDAVDGEIDLDADFGVERKKFSGKKIVLFFILPLLLVGGAAAAWFYTDLFGGGFQQAESAAENRPMSSKTTFFDLPEMLVNLNSSGRRPNFLKMQVSLELESDKDVEHLRALSPRIIDTFQVYLRELRVEDLRGSAGIYRLREELLARVNAAVRPAQVKDVLFRDMLVQ